MQNDSKPEIDVAKVNRALAVVCDFSIRLSSVRIVLSKFNLAEHYVDLIMKDIADQANRENDEKYEHEQDSKQEHEGSGTASQVEQTQ